MAGQDADEKKAAGMEPAELKQMLARARRRPVSAAAGFGDPAEGGLGLLLLDPVLAPKALMRQLKAQDAAANRLCFGTASVDRDADPKRVLLTMNKRAPGLERKLRSALKGSGYSKVSVKREETR